MPVYTMNPFSASRAVKKSKLHQTRGDTPRLVVSTKASKVQHILGISGPELTSARSQRRSSSSTTRAPTSSLSEATTAPVTQDVIVTDKILSPQPVHDLRLKASSVLLGNEIERTSTATGVSSTNLNRYPSSSTLHSHYDSSTAPLSVSQQTSDSSSRDFALRKGARSVITRTSQEMEHARQMILFKTSKSSRKDTRKLSKLLTKGNETSASSPITGSHSAYDCAPGSRIGYSSAVSLPGTPTPMTPVRKLLLGVKRSESQILRVPPATTPVTHDPYAKINVRRPKPGAKNWFDGIEGESDDEDNHNEPELKQTFVNEVQRAFGDVDPKVPQSPKPASEANSITIDVKRTPKSSTPSRVVIEKSIASDTSSSHKSLSRKVSFRTDKSVPDQGSLSSKQSMSKLNAFRGIDLNKQSILSLSSSDDEEDESDMKQPPAPLQPAAHIRESLAEGLVEVSDIEIGLAQTIAAKPGEPVTRAVHPRANAIRMAHPTPPAINVPPRASSRNASYVIDHPSENEVSENDIITSFPATPSDTASFRTSIRSSILSDTGSLASTRPMMVTKQEEKLLAAMRRKKATMHQSCAESNRSAALRVLESGAHNPAISPRQSRSQLVGQARLDLRLSNRYTPSHTHQHHRSLSDEDADARSGYARESGTTFDTSIYSIRDSQATMRTMFSDDRSGTGTFSTYSGSEVTPTSPRGRYYRNQEPNRRDTYFSMTSNASSYRRDSHVVVLDGLDEALHREHVPSQLFMEAPFIGWEQAGLAAAH